MFCSKLTICLRDWMREKNEKKALTSYLKKKQREKL